METTNSANRINRMPITRYHKLIIIVVAVAYFFEFADINTFSTTAPKIAQAWDLDVNHVAYITSISFVGMFIGSLLGGWLADRAGRKMAFLYSTLWFSVFSAATIFSWNMSSMGVLRFLTCGGLSAMTVVAVIYVNEIFPAKVRGKYLAYAMVVGICGTPVTNLIASAVVPLTDWSWRLVFLWGTLGVVILFLIRHLPESPIWLESKRRFGRAEAVLGEMESKISDLAGQLSAPAPPVAEVKEQKKSGFRTLMQRRYLMPLLVLVVLWVTQTVGFFGYSSWAPTLLSKQGISVEDSILYVALATIGAPLGSLLAAFITDKFERKWLLVIFGTAIGIAGLLYGLTFNPIMVVVFGFLVNMFERGYTSLAYAYSPELFDTRTRSLGTGIAYGVGRLSNAVGPLVIAGLYTSSGYVSVFIFIACTWFIGAVVLALVGSKTKVEHSAQGPENESPQVASASIRSITTGRYEY
ncbi:MFS transporter [Brevibacterium sp. UCMA 11754]|uniref:MFS transporter n=1 Tax=Brevibacterium sp. UCMA 11754 TaxID=2749198 RepID=UPI001F3C9CDA|nr:MFS transporter [Brevibacterium sp. UCMA 11754]MCF2573332.1 MFS transporter [Brevibacterium sp. UCMA 11754]